MSGAPAPGEGRTFTEEAEPVPGTTLTLVQGTSFAICEASGDIGASSVEGVYVADTRICARLVLRVDGRPLEPLTTSLPSPFQATVLGRTRDRELLVYRTLHVGRGMRVDLRVVNLTRSPRPAEVRLDVGTDLAHLFAVKEGRADGVERPARVEAGQLVVDHEGGRRGLVVRTDGAAVDPGGVTWSVTLPPGGEWTGAVELAALRGGEVLEPRYRLGARAEEAVPSTRQARWEAARPTIDSDVPGLRTAFDRAAADLGALRLYDPAHPDEPVIAAGAPWYMTLFGRDSLLTSWMALLLDPGLALSTLRALARLQGRRHDPASEEEPGRILHEVRLSSEASLSVGDGDVYYGTADATPLFVMLAHELWRWGTPLAVLEPLLPAVDAALGWLAGPGDPDGDGYVEYAPRHDRSLANQGWKDSFDGVSFADGTIAAPPIALAEVQAYAYAAWRAGAALARATGDAATAAERAARADALQAAFARDFWLPDRQAVALALDGDKRPVDAVASNMGHCLWTGLIADPDQAASIARWLVSPEMFSGYGVRTLATSMGRYNPLSYHNGSVWPHDTAICIAGLRRAGFVDEALVLAEGLLAAATASGGRLPELFAGLTPGDIGAPVPYPASCSPQAWAAASPLLVVRALLGLEPDLPGGSVALDPVLPAGARRLLLSEVPLGPQRVSIEVTADAVAVRGLPRGVSVVRPGR